MRLALLLAAGLLAACSREAPAAAPVAGGAPAEAPMTITPAGTPPSDAEIEGAIASINPLENDLRNLELAVRLADAFEVKDDGAVLILQVQSDTQGLLVDERFTLVEAAPSLDGFTEALDTDGFTVHPYALAAGDADRMAAAQARMLEIREAAPGQNELRFDASVFSCVSTGKTAPETYQFAIFVRSAPTVEFVPLGGDMEVARGASGASDGLFEPCPA